jgi:hypothetical protein
MPLLILLPLLLLLLQLLQLPPLLLLWLLRWLLSCGCGLPPLSVLIVLLLL